MAKDQLLNKIYITDQYQLYIMNKYLVPIDSNQYKLE